MSFSLAVLHKSLWWRILGFRWMGRRTVRNGIYNRFTHKCKIGMGNVWRIHCSHTSRNFLEGVFKWCRPSNLYDKLSVNNRGLENKKSLALTLLFWCRSIRWWGRWQCKWFKTGINICPQPKWQWDWVVRRRCHTILALCLYSLVHNGCRQEYEVLHLLTLQHGDRVWFNNRN